ncbi:hypothetical protein [Sphingomonas sp.]|uniref:hypothetical protein n=1 Tax=Sphingomonas sp. TaxID=28214 RepID=UPI001EC34CB2|nr:hypothetical protein [Sphingomonas sp.]MBX3593857.1 hypothetical protein [Sphingomonas sp.]
MTLGWASITLLAAGIASGAEGPVAIACIGAATAKSDGGSVRKGALQQQVFVFDASTETVRRAMMPRQEFEPVCGSEKGLRFVSISPGLVTVSSDDAPDGDPLWTCTFKADRMAGTARYILRGEWKDGRYHEIAWDMQCRKTEVPVFDLAKRKF